MSEPLTVILNISIYEIVTGELAVLEPGEGGWGTVEKADTNGKYADVDFTRVYASGYSAVSNSSEHLGLVSDTDWFAAATAVALLPS